MITWLKNNRLSVIGVFIGAVGGYLYWKYVGCQTGTCMITSKPINSTLYGSLMGYLIAGVFKKEVKKAD
ncbi:MAG TPA: DUF6132 family protein [Niabella sp.]|jgi:hypothetical protein|nr:hypothetical protein [Sphingobacteriales bacterium]MCO5290227.1 DUF6132 family protein [Chitinophagaceae bacterium]HRO85368.1 DUF6132 family protein [Niabella sp.]HUN03828.1 DUF6132 family protein [Niabella sp.]